MGQTHYWKRPTELDSEAFSKAVEDCRRAFELIDVALGGFDGYGSPVLTADTIMFNGAKGAVSEPFEIHRVEFDRRGHATVHSFCKTNGLPYDRCVKVALIVLKHCLGETLKVGSDALDSDWQVAREISQTALGYGLNFKLDDDEDSLA